MIGNGINRRVGVGLVVALGLVMLSLPISRGFGIPTSKKRTAKVAPVKISRDESQTSRTLTRPRLPLSFEPNQGQANSNARYLAHRPESTIYLEPDAATIVMAHSPSGASRHDQLANLKKGEFDSGIGSKVHASALRMRFLGASKELKITGEARLSGTANYFIGKDTSKWRSKISTFGRVHYASIYPGIDALFYGTDGELEYDLVVSPGADPSQVRLAFEGANRLELNRDGDLVASAGSDRVTIHKPAIYQVDGRGRKVVDGGFKKLAHNQIGLALANYDRSQPLVIDPTISYAVNYSTYVGGSALDVINWSAIDNAGNHYLTGMACSGDYPVGTMSNTPEYQKSYGGGCDAFVTVLNPSGTELIYSTYLGGDLFDEAFSIAVDQSGAAYVVGETAGDFPTVNAFQPSYPGAPIEGGPGVPIEGFVAKLSPDGSTLVYSTYLGGGRIPIPASEDRAFGVAVNPTCTNNCTAYVAGQIETCDFPTAGNPVQPLNAGYTASGPGCASSLTHNPFDGYVAELSGDGKSLIASTYLGGTGGDAAVAIAVDGTGNAYVTGLADGAGAVIPGVSDFRTTIGQTTFGGTADGFVVKLNSALSQIAYSTFLGGSGYDLGQDIVVDSTNHAYVVGYTYSIDFPTFGTVLEATSPAFLSGFLTKLNPNGTTAFSTHLGNISSQTQRVALDGAGNIYVAGWANLPTTYQTVNPVQATPPAAGIVLQSKDNGGTFNSSGFPQTVGSPGGHDIVVDSSTNPHTVYIGTLRNGLFVSNDDGASFSPTAYTGLVGSEYLDTNTTPPTLYFATVTGLFKAQGTAVSSTPVTIYLALLGIDTSVNPSSIYTWNIGQANVVQISTDGGNTFPTTIALPAGTEPYSIARDRNAVNTLYLGSNHGVLVSVNGGPFTQTLMNFSPAYQVIVDDNSNPSIVYAGSISQGVVWSTDGFSSTFNIPLTSFFGNTQALDLDRSTSPATLYVGTASGVLISSDGGQTYQTTQLGGGNEDIGSVAIDPGTPNGIFASLFLDTTVTIAAIAPDDSTVLFSSLFGGSAAGFAAGLAVSPTGSIYLAGGTFAHDFPTTPSGSPQAFQLSSTAQLSGFAANLSVVSVPAGNNQSVAPNGGTTITGNVSSPGTTTATTSNSDPVSTPPPTGYTPVSQFVDIATTATYNTSSAPITVCLNYNPTVSVTGADLSLLHFQQGQWADITTNVNSRTGVVCGQVTTFSPFVIARTPTGSKVGLEINPPLPAPVTINLGLEELLPFAILSSRTTDATKVSPASIRLAGATVAHLGKLYACAPVDVNHDRLPDLVCLIESRQSQLTSASNVAIVTGQTSKGQLVQGSEAIKVINPTHR